MLFFRTLQGFLPEHTSMTMIIPFEIVLMEVFLWKTACVFSHHIHHFHQSHPHFRRALFLLLSSMLTYFR